MIVRKTSVFPASRRIVFSKLQELKTLQYIARPYAVFIPVSPAPSMWAVGNESCFRLKLWGIIPFGIHTIQVVRVDPGGISSRERNPHVPVWNHDIALIAVDEQHTEYTDSVEIHAGWKTFFVWLWAKAFYRHRQRKWIKALKGVTQ